MKSAQVNPDEKLLHKHALELKRQGRLLSSASLADVLKGELKETFGGEAVNVYPLGSLVRASWRCLSPNAVFDGSCHVRIHWSDSIAAADADDAMSTTDDNDNNDSYKNDFEAAMRLNGIDEQQIIHEHLPANGSGGNVDSDDRDKAETDELALVTSTHLLKRFIAHYVRFCAAVPPLARAAVDNLFARDPTSRKFLRFPHYKGERALSKCEDLCRALSDDGHSRSAISGALLHGPPGTGKTELTKVCQRVGFTLLHAPLAAGELEVGGNVGDVARNLRTLLGWARHLSWVPLASIVDEIDTLAPDRLKTAGEKADANKQSAMGVLLTLFKGARDVPSLFMFGCTNRLDAMDEAFLRRVGMPLFVGVLSANDRSDWLKETFPVLAKLENTAMLSDMVNRTHGLTGDQFFKLVTAVEYRVRASGNLAVDLKAILIEQARKICHDSNVLLGDELAVDALALVDSPAVKAPLHSWLCGEDDPEGDVALAFSSSPHLSRLDEPTGRIFVDTVANKARDGVYAKVEIFRDGDGGGVRYDARTFAHQARPNSADGGRARGDTDRSAANVIRILTAYGICQQKVDAVRVLTGPMLDRDNIVDENSIVKSLCANVHQLREYYRAMLIIDVASVVGVSTDRSNEEDDDDDGASFLRNKTYSIVKPIVLHSILEQFSSLRTTNARGGAKKLFIALVATHPRIVRAIVERTDHLPLEREEVEAAKVRDCVRCTKQFTLATRATCRFHGMSSCGVGFECSGADGVVEVQDLTNHRPPNLRGDLLRLWPLFVGNIRPRVVLNDGTVRTFLTVDEYIAIARKFPVEAGGARPDMRRLVFKCSQERVLDANENTVCPLRRIGHNHREDFNEQTNKRY